MKINTAQKRSRRWLYYSILLLILASFGLGARPYWRGGGGWGRNSGYQRLYNPSTVTTVKGTVMSVDLFTPLRGMGKGVHLQLKSGDSVLPVHLGPLWFLEHQEMKFEKGDELEVKGSRVTFNGKEALIAAEVKKGDMVLTLRDENGFPVWAGGGRRR